MDPSWICWFHVGSLNRTARWGTEEWKLGWFRGVDFETKTPKRSAGWHILIGAWEPTFPGTFLGAVSPISLGVFFIGTKGVQRWCMKKVFLNNWLEEWSCINRATWVLMSATWHWDMLGWCFSTDELFIASFLDPLVFFEVLSFPIRWIF